MFDYAISHNQRRKPTRRLFVSAVASCLIHVLLLVVLLENPWLLKGGIFHRFRGLLFPSDSTAEYDGADNDRLIAVLRPMIAPSTSELREILNPGNNGEGDAERIRWGNDDMAAQDIDINISTVIEPEPKSVPAGIEDATSLSGTAKDNAPDPEGVPEVPSPESAAIMPNEPEGESEEITPVAESVPVEEIIASNTAPVRIPDSIPPPDRSSETESIKIFDNEQQAINSKSSGMFGAQGYPLKEYASLIKERVTVTWEPPSNLRDSDKHTTIVFFIDRDGGYSGVRIVESSGNDSLDLTALAAIMSSSPFPPLPAGYPGDSVGVKYIFIPPGPQ